MKSVPRTVVSLFLVIFAASSIFGETPRATTRERVQSNGLWSARLELKVKPGTEQNRAVTYEQKLYIHGPSMKTPRLLLSEASTRSIKFWLGSNGIVAAQSIGKGACVFFAERQQPLVLQAPLPTGTNNLRAHNAIFLHFDRCWFSGNGLLYESRMYGGADYIIGLFLIDEETKTVSPARICLEVTDANDSSVQSAAVYGDKILYAGTHVFWQNTGWDNPLFPERVTGTWRKSELRAFDLDRKRTLSGSEIPAAILNTHREALERVFGAVILQKIRTQQGSAANAPSRFALRQTERRGRLGPAADFCIRPLHTRMFRSVAGR